MGERGAPAAAHSWQQPPESARVIAGLVVFDRDAMDDAFEEDESDAEAVGGLMCIIDDRVDLKVHDDPRS